jgi:hypothetical protein
MQVSIKPSAKERPILFSGPMVRAILDGTKTQTRRIAKDITYWHSSENPLDRCEVVDGVAYCDVQVDVDDTITFDFPCKYGSVGDNLWVRETWRPMREYHGLACPQESMSIQFRASEHILDNGVWKVVASCADDNLPDGKSKYHMTGTGLKKGFSIVHDTAWRPSIHMPRWASRINLEITEIRAEPLRSITPADAIAEGIDMVNAYHTEPGLPYPVATFKKLWESIDGIGAWEANPWVWVITFRRVEI